MALKLNRVASVTALWIGILVFILVAANLKWVVVPYRIYLVAVWLGASGMVILIFAGALRAARYIPSKPPKAENQPWYLDEFLVSLLIFWALFPPSYFFIEYYAIDKGLLALPFNWDGTVVDKKDFLAQTKTYSDMAAKIWAGASAVLAAVLAVTKR